MLSIDSNSQASGNNAAGWRSAACGLRLCPTVLASRRESGDHAPVFGCVTNAHTTYEDRSLRGPTTRRRARTHHLTVLPTWARIGALLVPLIVALAYAQAAPADDASKPGNPILHAAIVGVLLHDEGPFADRLEAGSLDINVEAQFHRPQANWWRWIGSPYPHVGANVNIGGETSMLYAGLTWEYYALKRLAGTFSAGMAAHNGQLNQPEKVLCDRDGDCGFGSRLIFRFSAGIRYDVTDHVGVEAFYDHISHNKILDAENEGIDSVGLRMRYRF